MKLKRWKVTRRTNQGSYTVWHYFFKRKAKASANDFENMGLGKATVSKR